MDSLLCFINGQYLPLTQTGIPVNDLGFQRGYGIFDFLRVEADKPFFLEDHLDRFYRSASEMRLVSPLERDALKESIATLIAENDLSYSGIRIMLSGGVSKDGYEIVSPNLVITQQPLAPPPDHISSKGYTLFTYPYRRQIPHIKTTDYLMAVWLQPWLRNKGGDDILYQQDGVVSECPRSNFFIVTASGTVQTPGDHILKGISRKQVLAIAEKNGIDIEERDISIDDIRAAKEAFITSSTKRIIPVAAVDDTRFELKPGSVTAQLFDLFLAHERSYS